MIRRPAVILAILTGLNFFNYLDRILLSAVLPSVQTDLALGNFASGAMPTVFLIGYFATSPLFGARADRGRRKGLMALGVLVWSTATIGSGLAVGLRSMLVTRVLVGVGEAGFAALAPTLVDDLSPPGRKSQNLALFYLAIPVGSACGYLLGGYVEHHWGWRAAFYVAGSPGVVLAVLCLLIAEPARHVSAVKIKVADAVRSLAKIPLYRRSVLGYCAHTAGIGGFAYWSPKFLVHRYRLDLEAANFWFGLITVVAGFIATVVGGRLADRRVARLPTVDHADAGQAANLAGPPAHLSSQNQSAIEALLRICGLGLWWAAPIAAATFLAPTPLIFFTLLFFVQLGLFVAISPVSTAMMRAVPPELRASSMAVGIFSIHMFGDLWTPPAVGALADVLPMTAAMMLLSIFLAIGAWLWWPPRRRSRAR
jgi:MFS transporter, Spinster family, sphingosine-1-phosphate transporter